MKGGGGILCLFLALLLSGCRRPPAGLEDLPPLPPMTPGLYADINPRWSHDGQHIAFLRSTPDRRLQLFLSDAGLDRPLPLLEPELVRPDRPYSSSLQRYSSPDTLAWSPDDRRVAFERIEWFTFEDGQRLPGTGLWALDIYSGRVSQLALHPNRYVSSLYYYHSPEWSPDGRYLSFVAEGINGQRRIGICPVAAQKPKDVMPRFDNYEQSDWPVWRPAPNRARDRQNSTPSGRSDRENVLIYRQGILRTSAVPMTETLRCLQPGYAAGTGTGELWRMTSADYRPRLASPRADQAVVPRAGHLAWSPDGRYIAFSLTPDANDYHRYELWVMQKDGAGAERVSPANGQGYFAPVWIGRRALGALSPQDGKFAVVTIDIAAKTAKRIGAIDSADCDWSPNRRHIVYALPASDFPRDSDSPTTLRLFETGLRIGARD